MAITVLLFRKTETPSKAHNKEYFLGTGILDEENRRILDKKGKVIALPGESPHTWATWKRVDTNGDLTDVEITWYDTSSFHWTKFVELLVEAFPTYPKEFSTEEEGE